MSHITNPQQIKLYLRLKQQEFGIDKSLAAFIDNAKSDLENWKSIKLDIDKYTHERRTIEEPLKESVIDTYQELKSVKEMLTPDNVKKIDVESLKKKLQSLWKKIQDYKNVCNNTENLVSEQKNLNSELDQLNRKIRKHKKFDSNDNFYTRIIDMKAALQRQESTKEYDYSEVENLFALISNSGGHTGGWSEKDHLLYVKYLKKHKTTEAVALTLRAKCPDLTEEDILKHDAWYKTYLELRQKQKVAVQEWRERKEAERRRDKNPPEKEEKKTAIDKKSIAERNEAAIEKRKVMLNKWKEQKEKQKLVDEERLRSQVRSRKESRDIRRRVRNVKIRKLVSEYRDNKKICDKKESNNPIVKPRRPALGSSLFLQLYRARDQQYLEKRKKVLSKINAPKQSLQLDRRDFSKYYESTLLKETKAWQEKLKYEPKSAQTTFYIKNLPKLGKSNQTLDLFLNRQL